MITNQIILHYLKTTKNNFSFKNDIKEVVRYRFFISNDQDYIIVSFNTTNQNDIGTVIKVDDIEIYITEYRELLINTILDND